MGELLIAVDPAGWIISVIKNAIIHVELWMLSCCSFVCFFCLSSCCMTTTALIFLLISFANPRAAAIKEFDKDVEYWNQIVYPEFVRQNYTIYSEVHAGFVPMSFRVSGPYPDDVMPLGDSDVKELKVAPFEAFFASNNVFFDAAARDITDLHWESTKMAYTNVYSEYRKEYLMPQTYSGQYAGIVTAQAIRPVTKATLRCYEPPLESPTSTAKVTCKDACQKRDGHWSSTYRECQIGKQIDMDEFVFLLKSDCSGLSYDSDDYTWQKSVLKGYSMMDTGKFDLDHTTSRYNDGVPIRDGMGGTPIYIFNEKDPQILFTLMGGFGLSALAWMLLAACCCCLSVPVCACILCTPCYSCCCVCGTMGGILSGQAYDGDKEGESFSNPMMTD